MRHFRVLALLVLVIAAAMIGLNRFASANSDEVDQGNTVTSPHWTIEALALASGDRGNISLLNATEGWAIFRGWPFRYNGARWYPIEHPGLTRGKEDISISDIFPFSESDVWTRGYTEVEESVEELRLMHFDGLKWETIFTGFDGTVSAIDSLSPTDVWVVGSIDGAGDEEDSGIVHYDGVNWSKIPNTDYFLTDIEMLSATEGWSVGSDGAILHYNGTNWQNVSTLTEDFYLSAIEVLAPNDIWVAGTETTGDSFDHVGVLVHFDGANWQRVATPIEIEKIEHLEMVAPNDGWAMGSDSDIRDHLLHYNGTDWEVVVLPSDPFALSDISMGSADYGWISAFAHLYRYNGDNWSEVAPDQVAVVPFVAETDYFSDVDTLNSSEAWAVGNASASFVYVFHFNNGRWQKQGEIPQGISYDAPRMDMLSSSYGIVANDYDYNSSDHPFDTPAFYVYDGTSWTAGPIRSQSSYGVTAVVVNDVSVVASDEGWLTGSSGGSSLIENFNGTQLTTVYTKSQQLLNSIDMASPTVGWAVGDAGDMVYYNAGAWSNFDGPVDVALYDVEMLSPTEGWTVGAAGTILHYNGTNWQVVPSPVDNDLLDISMLSPTSGWIMADGEPQTLLRYDGTQWQVENQEFSDVDRITAIDNGALWGLAGGLILKYTNDVAEATGQVSRAGGGAEAGMLVRTDQGYQTKTDSQGNYQLPLPPGEHKLYPFKFGYTFEPPFRTVTVPPTTPGQNFVASASPVGTIQGKVTGPEDVALAQIQVHAYASTFNGSWLDAGATVTAADGAYTFDLPIGNYRLYFVDPSGSYRDEWYSDAQGINDSQNVQVTAQQTTNNVNITLVAVPAPQIQVDGAVSTAVSKSSGRVTVQSSRTTASSATFTRNVTCADGSAPTQVLLIVDVPGNIDDPDKEFPMTLQNGAYNVTLTLPNDLPNSGTSFPLAVSASCTEVEETRVGTIRLYDPSGQITNEQGEPIAGAIVSLYQVPDSQPDTDISTQDCRTIDTRPGGNSGEWNNLPAAAIDTGQWANPSLIGDLFEPELNPQVTGSDGRYGWDVAEGCWYVVIEAEGYATKISPVVGVPPAVTDLDIQLGIPQETPGGALYLPQLGH